MSGPDGRGPKKHYRGVFWNAERRVWRAQIFRNRISQTLGEYISEIEAARAYDEAVLRHLDRDKINTSVTEIVAALERGDTFIRNGRFRARFPW